MSYTFYYHSGLIAVGKSCLEAPHMSTNPLRLLIYARGFEAGGLLCELLLYTFSNLLDGVGAFLAPPSWGGAASAFSRALSPVGRFRALPERGLGTSFVAIL